MSGNSVLAWIGGFFLVVIGLGQFGAIGGIGSLVLIAIALGIVQNRSKPAHPPGQPVSRRAAELLGFQPAPSAGAISAEPDRDRGGFEFVGYEATDLPIVVEAQITYRDSKGDVTFRTITTKSLAEMQGGIWHIHARCHTANASRTFRADRISEFTDLVTGEIVADIPAYLKASYAGSPQGIIDTVMDEMNDEFGILIFIARADGNVRQQDYGTITEYLRGRRPRQVLDADLIKGTIKVCRQDQAGFRKNIKAVKTALNPDQRSDLLTAIGDIVSRRKSAPFGQAALALAKKALETSDI
ncbi:MAG: hypothetical protein QOJ54_447 [Aliidongia sp.]|nr:hypothetical protein [Aliidongia sp.]